MNRNTVLQIIAALITIAVLAGVHQGAGWIVDRMSSDFNWGFLSGAIFIGILMAIALRLDRSAVRRGRQQQRSRDIVDL